MQICSFPQCGRPVWSRGLCQSHYQQQRRGEELRPIQWQNRKRAEVCRGPECDRSGIYGGLCWAHRRQADKGQELRVLWSTKNRVRQQCSFKGCTREANSKGLCQTHRRQQLRGKELTPIHVPKYRYVGTGGYILLKKPEHPNAQKNGLVLEHIVVMSDAIGRPLLPDEEVHHKNGVPDDNALSNLELWSTSHPKGQRVEDKLEWAVEFIGRYRPELLAESLV